MKKIIFSVLIALMIVPTVCMAGQYSLPLTRMKPMVGNWYDSKGNLALTISSDYTINGCKILDLEIIGGEYFGLTYKVKILEKAGERDIVFFHHTGDMNKPAEEYHEFIHIGKQAFIRTKTPRYYESVGGIYLGMNKDKVLSMYGQPSKIDEQNFRNSLNSSTWSYEKIGLELRFSGDIVSSITIYPNSNLRFNKSGLSANDSMDSYKNFYRVSKISDITSNSFAMYIGHGESFSFHRMNGSVTLAMHVI